MSLKTLMSLGRRIFIICLVSFLAISAFGYFFWYRPKFTVHPGPGSFSSNTSLKNEVISRMKLKAAMAKDYVTSHGFSKTHCFLLDMREHSGKKRFFVYNLKKDSIELAGLVTHGSGSETDSDELKFSNESNSHSTSLGKYKIGKSYNGTFGLAYKLHGLDETNDNAFNRCVVLHGHSCVPNEQVYPVSICTSLGCPTVSPAFLDSLQNYLDHAKAPVLLWIYY